MIGETLLIILKAYLVLLGLQIVFWPIIKKIFADLPDEGWSITRFSGLILVSLVVWETAFLKLPTNTETGVITIGLIGLLVSLLVLKRSGIKGLIPKRDAIKVIVLEEYLFVVGFFGIALIRSYLPHLDSLEKFMDYGFIVRYLNSPTLPAIDMWQAGSSINYYSFGHFWGSVLIRILNVPPEIGYNLVLGFIAGVSLNIAFIVSYVLGKVVSKKESLVGGLFGAMVVVFGGNSHTVWYLIKNKGLAGYWYADATRFIYNTIHEFPGYSLVVSDLHGHLFDLPTGLMFILALYLFGKNKGWREAILMGFLFAVMMMTNTWDIPIYGLLLCVWLIYSATSNFYKTVGLYAKVISIFGVMSVLALPWWLQFTPISSGINMVTQRSPLWQLAALWGVAMIVNLLAWFVSSRKGETHLIRSLVITSILLIAIPELVYAKDIYPDHPRANTMFKLTYQAFIMNGVVFGAMVGIMANSIKEKIGFKNLILGLFLCIIFSSLMIFPTNSFPAFYENFKTFRGLNGENWLRDKSVEKFEVIGYLKNNKNGKNMIEAVGDSYTERNVVSAYSGVPTIQGWRVHEWLWRGGYDGVAQREALVREVYEGDDTEKSKDIIKRYGVGWIFVGSDEGDTYYINHLKLHKLGKEVWNLNTSYLIKVD